jgi:hypothetical protein
MQRNLDWQYLSNQFANALQFSYGNTLIFVTDHAAKLQNNVNNAAILTILPRTLTALELYQEKMAKWQKANAFWKGDTNKIDDLLLQLRQTKVPRWEHKVEDIYLAGTPEYITLFPNGRTGFRNGGKDVQIQNLKAFIESLSEYPALFQLKSDVEAFYNIVLDTRNRQQQREQEVRNSATELRDAQEIVFNILYANLGFLMHLYYESKEEILNYFQVELIRTTATRRRTDETEDIEPLYDIEEEDF